MLTRPRKAGLFITLLLQICCATGYCQQLNFDVFFSGSKVGAMQVEQKDSAGFKVYHMHSKFEAKILFTKRSSESNMHVVFDNNSGNMIYSYYKNIKSDAEITTVANLQNGKLNVVHNGDKWAVDVPFNASSVLLYFAPPQKLQKIFSERAGKLFDMIKKDEGVYQASLDDGTAKFTYAANKLSQIEVSKGILGTIIIKAVQ